MKKYLIVAILTFCVTTISAMDIDKKRNTQEPTVLYDLTTTVENRFPRSEHVTIRMNQTGTIAAAISQHEDHRRGHNRLFLYAVHDGNFYWTMPPSRELANVSKDDDDLGIMDFSLYNNFLVTIPRPRDYPYNIEMFQFANPQKIDDQDHPGIKAGLLPRWKIQELHHAAPISELERVISPESSGSQNPTDNTYTAAIKAHAIATHPTLPIVAAIVEEPAILHKKRLAIWSINATYPEQLQELPASDLVHYMRWHPNGEFLAFIGADSKPWVFTFDTTTQRFVSMMSTAQDASDLAWHSIAWHSSMPLFAAHNNTSNNLELFECTKTVRRIATSAIKVDGLKSLTWHPKDAILVAAGRFGIKIMAYDTEKKELSQLQEILPAVSGPIKAHNGAVWHPNGERFSYGSVSGSTGVIKTFRYDNAAVLAAMEAFKKKKS